MIKETLRHPNCTLANADEMQLEILNRDKANRTVRLKWNANEALNDHWMVMDSKDGELSIENEEEKTVILYKVPDAGTVVYLFAVTPEAKQRHWISLKIPAE